MPVTGTNFNYPRFSGGKGKDLMDAFAAVDTAISNVTVGVPANSSVTNAKVAADAAIAYSKLAALTDSYILVGSSGNVATAVAVTGDVTISNAGVTAIAAGVIVDADVKSDAAVAYSKLAASTDIDTSGQVVDLTITDEAQGDILYRNASNWVRLAAGVSGQSLLTAGAGANPYWGAPTIASATKIAQAYEIESGTYDIVHDVTSQTSSAPTLTIPDFAGVDDTYAFCTLAQTLTNKTLTAPEITYGVASHDYAAGSTAWTLSASELKATHLFTTNAGAAADLIAVPTPGKEYRLINNSTHTITIKAAGQTGVAVANTKAATVIANAAGTDFVRLTADA